MRDCKKMIGRKPIYIEKTLFLVMKGQEPLFHSLKTSTKKKIIIRNYEEGYCHPPIKIHKAVRKIRFE
jgi:hypothetical protein